MPCVTCNETDWADDETGLSFDDPHLIEKLERRGTYEDGAMSWEELRSEFKESISDRSSYERIH